MIALQQNRHQLASGLANDIREKITSGQLKPGDVIPPSSALAKTYNIGHNTANRALSRLVDEGLIERRKGLGTFVLGQKKGRRCYKIGAAFGSHIGDAGDVHAAFSVFQKSTIQQIKALGHDVRHLTVHELQDPELTDIQELDGIILSADFNYNYIFNNLQKAELPIVLIQHTTHWPVSFHQVIPDMTTGYNQALEEIKKQDPEKLIIASYENVAEANWRKIEFFKCAINAGICPDKIKFFSQPRLEADLGRLTGQQLGNKILKEVDNAVIFSISDFLAFGIVDAMLKQDVPIGGKVRLISFDNLEGVGVCPFGEPILTSVNFPRQQITKKAVDLLLSLLESQETYLNSIRIPTNLIARKSFQITGESK